MAGSPNGNVVMVISDLALCIFLYGLYIPVGLVCFRHLLSSRSRNRLYYIVWFYFIISVCLATIFTATYLVSVGKQLFCLTTTPQELKSNCGNVTLDKQLFTIKQTSLTAFKLNLLLADALSLYRLSVVWSDYKLVIALPVILYLGSLVLNCYTIFTTFVVSWGISQAGIISATVFDVACTALIASRLLVRRKKTKRFTIDLKNSYATLSTILIESSILNAITRLVYAATGGGNPDGSPTWPALLAASGAIFAPTFIIIRLQIHITSKPDRQKSNISTIRFADDTRSRAGITPSTSSAEVDDPPSLPEIALESLHFPPSETDGTQSSIENKVVDL